MIFYSIILGFLYWVTYQVEQHVAQCHKTAEKPQRAKGEYSEHYLDYDDYELRLASLKMQVPTPH